jgi:hypothetical protein
MANGYVGKKPKIKTITSPKTKKWDGEIVYAFKDVRIDFDMNPDVYGENDAEKISKTLTVVSKEIWIDKTYVDFKGTKFKKTFLLEDGWNSLRELVLDTDYGKRCTKYQRNIIDGVYREMIVEYIRMVFDDMGWDVENLAFSVDDKIPFKVEYYPDVAEEWKRYPGEWQTWPENN